MPFQGVQIQEIKCEVFEVQLLSLRGHGGMACVKGFSQPT